MNRYIEMDKCALCENPSSQATVLFDLNEEQRLLHCSVCGLIYNDRCRADIENIYDDDYYEGLTKSNVGGYFSYSRMEKATNKTDRFATAFIKSRCKGRNDRVRLLDIGCGYGFFLKQFKGDDRFELVGIEASRKAADEASKFVAEIIHKRIEESDPRDFEKFDFITAFEVIEHVSDPRSFMMKAHSFLKDRGHLLLSMPDAGSFFFRMLKSRWPGIHPHYHNVYFSKATVSALARKCGFEVVRIRSKQYYYTNVRHVRKRLLELFSIFGRVFVLLKPLDAMTVPFLNGGDLQVILRKKGDKKS